MQCRPRVVCNLRRTSTTVDAVLGAARAEAAARSLALLPPTRSVARWIDEEDRPSARRSASPPRLRTAPVDEVATAVRTVPAEVRWDRSSRTTSVSPKARASWAPVTVVVQRRRGLSAVVLHGSLTERR